MVTSEKRRDTFVKSVEMHQVGRRPTSRKRRDYFQSVELHQKRRITSISLKKPLFTNILEEDSV